MNGEVIFPAHSSPKGEKGMLPFRPSLTCLSLTKPGEIWLTPYFRIAG
jgi:hypothetical protein